MHNAARVVTRSLLAFLRTYLYKGLGLGIALSLCPSIFAQATGTVSGRVTDASGAVIAGAHITATNVGTHLTRTTQSDGAGQFTIPFVPVGTYELQVLQNGFATFTQRNILVHDYATIQVNAQLAVKSAVTQVTVSSNTVMLQAQATNIVQVVAVSDDRVRTASLEYYLRERSGRKRKGELYESS